MDLAGYIPARTAEPQTSNNRAEVAGVLAAYEFVRRLGESGVKPGQVYVWSDSKYAVFCGNGDWRRKKNTDLWAAYDVVLDAAKQATGATIELAWVKGHASNQYNSAADELATLAAFNFDEAAHKRFRAAQTATGREMPGAKTLAQYGVKLETKVIDAPAEQAASNDTDQQAEATSTDEWQADSDYAVLLLTQLDGGDQARMGCAPCTGTYRLTTSKGRSHQTRVRHAGERIPDEGEYLTLLSALDDLTKRIKAAGREPGNFTLTVFSGRELMTKQLTGAYQVKSHLLRPLYEQARGLLKQFERVEIVLKPSALLKKELR
jgi:ribonuclease HI